MEPYSKRCLVRHFLPNIEEWLRVAPPETVSQLVPSLTGLQVSPLRFPGTHVPGFPVAPLRGWSNRSVDSFAGLAVATRTHSGLDSYAPLSSGEALSYSRSALRGWISRATFCTYTTLHIFGDKISCKADGRALEYVQYGRLAVEWVGKTATEPRNPHLERTPD